MDGKYTTRDQNWEPQISNSRHPSSCGLAMSKFVLMVKTYSPRESTLYEIQEAKSPIPQTLPKIERIGYKICETGALYVQALSHHISPRRYKLLLSLA